MKKLMPVSFTDVKLTDGFWKNRYESNKNVTIYSVRNRFKDTGRFEAFRFNWTEDSDIPRPHLFWDSDVAKWMESVAYILVEEDVPELRKEVEDLISLIEEHQQDDGYFNIAHTVVHPEKKFRVRDNHELYCLGHLIEAAVAWKIATGSDRLIRITDKYIDLVIKVFCEEKSAGFTTPGHEEIELALIRLYRLTSVSKYLDLALFFINERGKIDEYVPDWCNSSYNQSHLPVRDQKDAYGHAVRACYLYSAMADAARETDDTVLFKACKNLFDDIVNRKMYITGGVGSSHHGEAFTVPYDLPSDTAYAETCASISLMMFADRMKDICFDSVYADIVEKEIYNGIISGVSLDGKAFFYENPLEINLSDRTRHTSMTSPSVRLPITRRQEVFSCSCCPPNLTRFFASLGDHVFSENDDSIVLHQYTSCEAVIKNAHITVKTQYPSDGKVTVDIQNFSGRKFYFRIPAWCKDCQVSSAYTVINGYGMVCVDTDNFTVDIDFNMKPEFYLSNPSVRATSGKVALMYGPVVYCFEAIDNPGVSHYEISVDTSVLPEAEYDENYGCNVLYARAFVKNKGNRLYFPIEEVESSSVRVKLIPYFAFANRKECDMAVWLNY